MKRGEEKPRMRTVARSRDEVGKRGNHDNVVSLGPGRWSSEEIVQGLVRRDPAAARALYDEHGEQVNRLVWRLLGADPDHDDVVQQVFVNILSSVEKVQKHEALRAWITGVTVNTVRRELRSRKFRRIVSFAPEAGMDVACVETDRQRSLVRSFYRVAGRMRTEDRIAFVLHHVEGQTLTEVAGSMRCSLATVKRRISRARRLFASQARKETDIVRLVEELKNDG